MGYSLVADRKEEVTTILHRASSCEELVESTHVDNGKISRDPPSDIKTKKNIFITVIDNSVIYVCYNNIVFMVY